MKPHWSKALGFGIGFYVGGPVGALLGYFVGKKISSHEKTPVNDSQIRECYDTLRVPPTASMEDVKKSYRRLVKKYHPDLQGPMEEMRARLYREKMVQVNTAYRTIRGCRQF